MIQKDGNKAPIAAGEIRKSVSLEIEHLVEILADRAQMLADQVNSKLHSVMTSDRPQIREEALADIVEYPPLFAALRVDLMKIGGALESIENAMSRTEL